MLQNVFPPNFNQLLRNKAFVKIFILSDNHEFNFAKKFCFCFLYISIHMWNRLIKSHLEVFYQIYCFSRVTTTWAVIGHVNLQMDFCSRLSTSLLISQSDTYHIYKMFNLMMLQQGDIPSEVIFSSKSITDIRGE